MDEEKRNISATTGTYDQSQVTTLANEPDTRFGAVMCIIHDELGYLEKIYMELNRSTLLIQEPSPTEESAKEREDRTAGETKLEDELLGLLDRVRTVSRKYNALKDRIQP